MSDEEYRQIRGSDISMIFQEPSAALNPVATIGAQITENIMLHSDMKKEDAVEAGGRAAEQGRHPKR